MARETKVGLLVGLCFVLLIGILISDQLSTIHTQEPSDLQQTLRRPVPERDATSVGNPNGDQGVHAIPMPEEATPAHRPETFTGGEGLLLRGVEVNPQVGTMEGQTPVYTPAVGATHDIRPTDPTGILNPRTEETPTNPRTSMPSRTMVNVRKHQVAEGEYLTEIARLYYGDSNAWRRIRDANPSLVSENGGVRAGAELVIPPAPERETAGTPSRTLALEGTGMFERVGPVPAPVGSQSSTRTPATIKVESGDNLTKLAQRHLGDGSRWRELMAANPDQLKRDTDLRAGMVLKLPTGASSGTAVARSSSPSRSNTTYTVRSGDSLSKIAEAKLGDKDQWEQIYRLNRSKISDPTKIRAGMVLVMP